MGSNRLFWQIVIALVIPYFLLAAGFITVIAGVERSQIKAQVESQLLDTARAAAGALYTDRTSPPSDDAIQQLAVELGEKTGSRVTIVRGDGLVIGDSDEEPAEMNNHANRPEIVEAGTLGQGVSERFSVTLGEPMMYACVRVVHPEDQGFVFSRSFVRVARPTRAIEQRIAGMQRFQWTFGISLAAVAVLLTSFFFVRTLGPLRHLTDAANAISRGQYDAKIDIAARHRVWQTFVSAFEKMQSELDQREQALRENGERLETVLRGMSEGVIAIARDGSIEFANEAACQYLSIPSQDCAGRQLVEMVRIPMVQETINQAWESDQPVRCEFEMRGTPRRTLMMRLVPMHEQRDRLQVAVIHDVTELRQLERMRRDFVANVSHELKTPLSAIKAYAETLRLGAIHDEERNMSFVEQIEDQAERLHQLIIDLIRLARVESAQQVFDLAAVDMVAIVEASVESFSGLALSREVTLRTENIQGLKVMADAEGLRAIIDNLISNALRYTQAGGSVTVRCFRDGRHGVLQVIDTGLGIAEEHQHRVFERFYRVDKARSSDLGGTGLGLAIVKHVSNAFGGSVDLDSKPGRGSTFTVKLPAA